MLYIDLLYFQLATLNAAIKCSPGDVESVLSTAKRRGVLWIRSGRGGLYETRGLCGCAVVGDVSTVVRRLLESRTDGGGR